MAKKLFIIGLIFSVIFCLATPAHCGNAVKKLGRGICNVITCPFEILQQAQKVNDSDGPMAGLTYGLLKGVGMTGIRAVIGVYEIVTFPIPLPRRYEPILKDPEFFFEDMIW